MLRYVGIRLHPEVGTIGVCPDDAQCAVLGSFSPRNNGTLFNEVAVCFDRMSKAVLLNEACCIEHVLCSCYNVERSRRYVEPVDECFNVLSHGRVRLVIQCHEDDWFR